MPELNVNDIRINVELDGPEAAPPLMLIAGLASDSLSWEPVRAALAERFRLIMPDNRGAGRSQAGLDRLSIPQIAEDSLAILSALNIERADVLGHSMGGIVALEMAARAPERVDRLVICASAVIDDARNAAMLDTVVRLRSKASALDQWLPVFFLWIFGRDFFARDGAMDDALAMAEAHPYPQGEAAFAAQVAAVKSYGPPPDFAAISHSTLLLLGGDDLLFPPHIAQQSLSALPALSSAVIAGAGHALHWDAPDAFVNKVIDFLA